MMQPIHGLLAAALIITVGSSTASAQQAQGCDNLNDTEGAKIVLGRMLLESSQGSADLLADRSKNRLRMELQSRLNNLFNPSGSMRGVLCAEHDPEVDGSTFTQQYVEALDARDVLMEIWGSLSTDDSSGTTMTELWLYIMVFPVRLQALDGVEPAPYFHSLMYPPADRGAAVDALSATAFGPEFEIYALLAHAVKSFRNRRWDAAQSHLDRALLLFEHASAQGTLAQTLTQSTSVLSYMAKLQERISAGVASDPSYRGDLALVNDALRGSAP